MNQTDLPEIPAPTERDWRSDRERHGWCRCGKREDESSSGCEWHNARAERTDLETAVSERSDQ